MRLSEKREHPDHLLLDDSERMQTERELRQQIVEIGRRIYELGFVAASDGNVSARLYDGHILTTPTMVCKGRMT